MIPTVFNGMIAILMARFFLNDLPHAAGVLDNPSRRFPEPPQRPHKHLPKPVARVITVPGGSRWQCTECGRMLEAGGEAVKIGGKVYCVECARGGNPNELSALSSFTEEEVKDIKDIAEYLRNFYASWEGRKYSHEEILQQAIDEFLRRKRVREWHKRSEGGNPSNPGNPSGLGAETETIMARAGLGEYKPPPFGVFIERDESITRRRRRPPASIRTKDIWIYRIVMEKRDDRCRIKLYEYISGRGDKLRATWSGEGPQCETKFEQISGVVRQVEFEYKSAMKSAMRG